MFVNVRILIPCKLTPIHKLYIYVRSILKYTINKREERLKVTNLGIYASLKSPAKINNISCQFIAFAKSCLFRDILRRYIVIKFLTQYTLPPYYKFICF